MKNLAKNSELTAAKNAFGRYILSLYKYYANVL